MLTLFDLELHTICYYKEIFARLAGISPIPAPLKAIAQSVFLEVTDSCDFKSLRIAEQNEKLDKWGMWWRKTSSIPIIATANVQCKTPLPNKPLLKDCIAKDTIPVKGRPDKGLWEVDEAPAIQSGAWVFDLDIKRGEDGRGAGFALLYKAADGDRLFPTEAPTLRSLSATNGKQGGSGAVKVREFNGELYCDRPLLPQEAEALMGWTPESTAQGINAAGETYTLCNTHRHKILGNGIVPAEIEEILNGLKSHLSTPGRDLTAGFVFAGGGGCSQGAKAAGFPPIFAVEVDKHAASVYRYRYPEAQVIEADVQQLSDEFIETLVTPDVLIWGSPCPDFSTAGKRAGLTGDRGRLFFEGLRFLRLLKPKVFIFENVVGLLSIDEGRAFQQVINEFASLGYMGTWQLRNANRHVPQNRQRIFCVGWRED